MPAHKRSSSENRDDEDPELHHHHHAKQPRREPEFDDDDPDGEGQQRSHREDEEVEDDDEEDSEDSASSGTEEKPEFVTVELPEIRKDVQCPICLGIIKKTRTVMECLHRFCRECIDKSMRLGNNECPACRTHCASRRSLRDDPNYDALIAALYPDIDKYDEEELAFHEEERTRNKQIQAAIAEISQRQTEALVKRRAMGKDSAFATRSQRRNAQSRRRRNYRGMEHGSEDNEDENEAKYSSSNDERCTEVRQRRNRRHPGARLPQPSPSAPNSDGACLENDMETSREGRGISPGLVWNSEMLGWGRGGTRSHTRHSGSNNKSSRISRLSKLADYLRSTEVNSDELDVHVMLVSSDTKTTPSLQQLYLRCQPCLSIRHLCEYIASKTPLQAEDIEVLAVKGNDNIYHDKSVLNPSTLMNDPDPVSLLVSHSKDKLQTLEGQEALSVLKANFTSVNHHLFLAYRQKETT